MSGLNGNVAIVTGGGSGLGEAMGKALARKGAKVVLSDIRREAAERVARPRSRRPAEPPAPPGYRQAGRLRGDRAPRGADLTGGYYHIDGGYTAV